MIKYAVRRFTLFPKLLSPKHLNFSTMADHSVEVVEAKSKLRHEIMNKMENLTLTEKLRQTYIITSQIISHPDFQRAERIAIYLNMKNEVGTYDILKEAFNGKKQVFIPLVAKGDMKMVRLNSWEELNAMPKSKWGIIQPSVKELREDCLETGGVSFVVTPGVAFTTSGLRLGHGKGYYDRFLARNDKVTGSKCISIGVGFNVQIVDDLPVNENDFRITGVVYPDMGKHIETPSEFSLPPKPFTI